MVKKFIWTKELEEELVGLLESHKTMTQIVLAMKLDRATIIKKCIKLKYGAKKLRKMGIIGEELI